jgi:vancomycin resistance protein YoaR
MADQFQSNPSKYTPRSTQAAPPYADGIPDSADRIDCSFDDSASWDSPLDRLPVDKPIAHVSSIGQNPFAQKRWPQDPVKAKKQKKRTAMLVVYCTVIALCLFAVAAVAVLMMPQVAGYFWKDLDNCAFINGELLRYNSETVLTYNQYKEYLARDVIYPGVFVDGVYVGGMTPEEAITALGDENAASASFSITISIGDKVWTLDNTNVSAHRDVTSALVKAYSYGRQNTTGIASTSKTPFRERTDTVIALRTAYADVQSQQAYDYATIQSVIDDIVNYVTRDPIDSEIVSFDFNTRTFTFSDDQPGVTIDGTALYNQVIGLLQQGVTKHSITVSPTLTLPTVTKEDLESTFQLVSAFTTKTTSDSDRNNNISVACQAINGTVLLPDETFSFNGTVGERTTSRGYREAGAIAGGELVDEVGGGICQVSSTLFNAVARANLQIVNRSPHAWPSSYVNKGEDATVNWPSLDFKFKNNTDTPIFIITYYKDRQCTAEIWGKTLGENVKIDLSSTITKTIEPSTAIIYIQNPELPVGTSKETVKMRVGYVVDTYKVWYQNNAEFKREYLHTSTYKAYQKTIEYN